MSASPVAVSASRTGILLPEPGVWLDAHRSVPFSFITHAHSDHVARHATTICSEPTARLLRDRFNYSGNIIALPWDTPWEHAGHRFSLTPAGHVLGSAMVHVTRLSDGASLLYTGDFKLRAGLSAEAARPVPADSLIMECTFGQPHYVFPPFDHTRAAIIDWCRHALDSGQTPVLLAYSLGKAQELQMLLGGLLPVAVHSSVAAMNRTYEDLGWPLPPWETISPETSGRVLIIPPSASRQQSLRKRQRLVSAMVSGWALNSSARFQYQSDDAFPLSDHADWPDLLHLVDLVRPSLILTTHGPAADFASALRSRGWNAWSLLGSDQLELSLASPITSPPDPNTSPATTAPASPPSPTSEFSAFADICDAVAAAPGRSAKSSLLAPYLNRPTDAATLATSIRFLAGKPAATRDQLSNLQTGPALIRQALIDAAAISLPAYRAISRAQNDAGRTAFLVLDGRTSPQPWSLADVQALFDQLLSANSPSARLAILTKAFRSLSPREAQYVVKILTGDTRLGLKEGLLEDAVANAFNTPPESVRSAHMLNGDLGTTAILARDGRLDDASLVPFQALKPMLASPVDSTSSAWDQRPAPDHPAGLWLEDKFDGIRAQLHVTPTNAALFSRDLRNISREFPELIAAASSFPDQIIADGEIIAPGLSGHADFAALQKRLGRREPDLFLTTDIPVRCILFDLLWLNGNSLIHLPLQQRRLLLDSLQLPKGFERIAVRFASSPTDLDRAFLDARRAGNEGVILKDPESPYSAGRRGRSWLKLKRSPLSLDVVVTAVQQGHGKRSHLLSDFTFAVRDPADGSLKNIGKAYSGLTDAELESLTEHFSRTTISTDGRTRTVTPDTVLEVTFDAINPSRRHPSGFALRFPRIRALRHDKSPDDIDTLTEAARLAALSSPLT